MSVATQHGYPDSQNGQTFAGCLPYMCGSDPGNQAAILACSFAGYGGVFSCDDPACTPYCPNQRLDAAVSPAVSPAVSKIPSSAIIKTAPPKLTPQNIVSPIPDVTRVFAAVPYAVPCSFWSELNQSIMNNPVVAAGILGLAFLAIWRGKK